MTRRSVVASDDNISYIYIMLRFDDIENWPRTMIFAHRGAGHHGRKATTHENTFEAFRKAIDIGADGIELDVRRTADGVLIVHHDENVKRYRRPLSEMTLEEANGAGHKRGYRIPTFNETLQICAGRIALDIELKEAGYEVEVIRLVKQYYDLQHIGFTSFIDASVKRIKEIERNAITGLLLGVEPPAKPGTRFREIFPIRRVRRCGADFVAPNRRLLRLGYVQRIEKAGYPIIAWTVNNKNRAAKLMEQNIAGVISDVPEQLIGC
jgi:glycerophosphoryl diester phosphodiesterase